jgi:hypothetical protein
MKKQLFALLGLGLLLVTASAYAQTLPIEANVPFDFIVNGATMPSGGYSIDSIGESGKALFIHNLDQKARSLVLSNRCEKLSPSKTTKLVFHRYGDRYFLTQIWVRGENAGRQLPVSRREAEMARDYTMQEVVLVAQAR